MSAPTLVGLSYSADSATHLSSQSVTRTGVTGGNLLFAICSFFTSDGANAISGVLPTDTAGDVWPTAVLSRPSLNGPYAAGIIAHVLPSASAGTHTLNYAYPVNEFYARCILGEVTPATLDQAVGNNSATNNEVAFSVVTALLASNQQLAIAVAAIADQLGGTTNMGISDPPLGFNSERSWQNEATVVPPGQVSSLITSANTALTAAWSWSNGGSGVGAILTFQPVAGPAPSYYVPSMIEV